MHAPTCSAHFHAAALSPILVPALLTLARVPCRSFYLLVEKYKGLSRTIFVLILLKLYYFVGGSNLTFPCVAQDTATSFSNAPQIAGEACLYRPSGSMLVIWAFCIHRARAGPCQVPPRPGKSLSGTIEEGDWRESVRRGSFNIHQVPGLGGCEKKRSCSWAANQ